MAAYPILLSLLFLVGPSWSCRQADWQAVLDQSNVWATCGSDKEYIRGLWRHENVGGHDERLGRIEFANCCSPPASYANMGADCLNDNWWSKLDK